MSHIRLEDRCYRCFAFDLELHKHHLHRKSDGGSHDPKNLKLLCVDCHQEWHRHFEGEVEFDWWVDNIIPPRHAVVLPRYPLLTSRKWSEIRRLLVDYFTIQDELDDLQTKQEQKIDTLLEMLTPFISDIQLTAWVKAE